MNKRLRKKRHLGEFAWKGFNVECTFDPPLTESQIDAFCDAFIDFAEAHELALGGGCSPTSMGYYVTRLVFCHWKRNGEPHFKRAHCTEAHMALVKAWIVKQPSVTNLTVGPLTSG